MYTKDFVIYISPPVLGHIRSMWIYKKHNSVLSDNPLNSHCYPTSSIDWFIDWFIDWLLGQGRFVWDVKNSGVHE